MFNLYNLLYIEYKAKKVRIFKEYNFLIYIMLFVNVFIYIKNAIKSKFNGINLLKR